MNEKNFHDKNKQSSNPETSERIDEDLNQESVTDAMRGENNVPESSDKARQQKKQPTES